MNVIFSFLPVFLLLTFLFLLDSFNLVRVKTLIIALLLGIVCAVLGFYLNTWVAKWLAVDYTFLSRYIGPVTEETMKALVVVYLISKKKIGFIVDGAVYGFAVGTGFSLLENIYFLSTLPTKTDPKEVAIIVLLSVSLSFLATIYPARRASKLDPAEALRYE